MSPITSRNCRLTLLSLIPSRKDRSIGQHHSSPSPTSNLDTNPRTCYELRSLDDNQTRTYSDLRSLDDYRTLFPEPSAKVGPMFAHKRPASRVRHSRTWRNSPENLSSIFEFSRQSSEFPSSSRGSPPSRPRRLGGSVHPTFTNFVPLNRPRHAHLKKKARLNHKHYG